MTSPAELPARLRARQEIDYDPLAFEAAARIEELEAALRDVIKADDDFRASLSPKADRDPLTVIVDRVRSLLTPEHPNDQH